MFVKPANWNELDWKQKRELRLSHWMSAPGIKFISKEAEKGYKARCARLAKAVKMEIPDRVPCMIPTGWYPAYNAGVPLKSVMYDPELMKKVWLRFVDEYDSDTFDGTLFFQGQVSDLLQSKTQKWPGHGLPDDAHSYQFVESVYMKADEYDLFMKDPFDFQLRKLLPRQYGIFEAFADIPSFSSYQGFPQRLMAMALDPKFQHFMQVINEAAQYGPKFAKASVETTEGAAARGFPVFRGGMAVAPFDVFADSLRGTQGIVMDMFRQPDKIHEGMEFVLPQLVEGAARMCDMAGCPVVMMPLHKGDDTFMSDKQFETFYWPTFRRQLLAMVEDGLIPYPVAEGAYNRRLEVISDMPKGCVAWMFDQTNMANAKKTVGRVSCIAGNVPVSIAYTKSAAEMKEYCKKLIETCAPGGGYILTGGCTFDKAKPENLRAMMEAAKEYGKY
jgi:uroporphyrinogen-III decarboxylase